LERALQLVESRFKIITIDCMKEKRVVEDKEGVEEEEEEEEEFRASKRQR